MRVLLRSRRRDEEGAIAVLTGLFVIILCVISAFAIDLGMAYNSDRQLQTSADSAALAAGSIYAKYSGTCDALADNSAYRAEAEAAADDYSARNWLDYDEFTQNADGGITEVACNADGELEITYAVTGSTDTVFSKVINAGDTIATGEDASAVLDVPPVGRGLRPLAICGAEVPATVAIGDSWKVYGPSNGHVPPAGCPVPSNPGSWWTLDCPSEFDPLAEQDGGGTRQLERQIRNGCSDAITIVPNQGSSTGQELNDILSAACPSVSQSAPFMCLSGDPGAPDAGQVEVSWQHLIDSGTTVTLPVFCAPSKCAQSSVSGTGTNAVFPVHRIVTVDICGFHFGSQLNRRYVALVPSVACAPLEGDMAALMADGSDTNYLLLVFQNMQISGSTEGSSCALGTDCDNGLRRVLLSE